MEYNSIIPKRMDDLDDILKDIATETSTDEEVDNLGSALGMSATDIAGYHAAKTADAKDEGTLRMLLDWRKTQTSSTEKAALGHILKMADRSDLYDRYLLMPDVDLEEVQAQYSDAESNEDETELNKLREKIKNYEPGQRSDNVWDETFPTVINIGLFGVAAVGKSALINSLNFAFKGEYETVAAEGRHDFMGIRTRYRDAVRLTDHIHVMDNRPMKDYSLGQIKDSLIPQIGGKRGLNPHKKIPNGRVVHCPAFVSDFTRNPCPQVAMHDFLQQLSANGYSHSERQLMIVATNKESQRRDFQTQRELLHSQIGFAKDNIWVFENYTERDHEHDDTRSIEYLRFLLKCLDVAESNVMYDMKRSKESCSLWCRIKQRLNGKTAACLLVAVFIHFIFMSQVSLNRLPFFRNSTMNHTFLNEG